MGQTNSEVDMDEENDRINISIQDQEQNKNLTFMAGEVIKGKVMLDMTNNTRPGNLKVGIYGVCL